jgi:N-formylglutamate amidohydrolase
MTTLVGCFERAFGEEIAVNEPFSGGHITRLHGQERPWLQVELSRAPFLSNDEKRMRVFDALSDFCRRVPQPG